MLAELATQEFQYTGSFNKQHAHIFTYFLDAPFCVPFSQSHCEHGETLGMAGPVLLEAGACSDSDCCTPGVGEAAADVLGPGEGGGESSYSMDSLLFFFFVII